MKLTNVKIEGHRGTWYSITEGRKFVINGKEEELFLYEHEKYGDEAAHVIANSDGKLYMENVWNGWWDWKEYVLSEQGYNRKDFPLVLDGVFSI